jgi:hypothetical protein
VGVLWERQLSAGVGSGFKNLLTAGKQRTVASWQVLAMVDRVAGTGVKQGTEIS